MTLFCAKAAHSQSHSREVFSGLLDMGCQWDQEVQGGKTALSFLVHSWDYKLIEWCVGKGANLQKGRLLVYASKGLTKSQYEERAEIEIHHRYLTLNGMTPLADPELIHPPYENRRVFTYLVLNGAPVNEVDSVTGMTPLITACCEDNLEKVRLLLQHGATDSLYRKNKEGMDAFAFAKLQARKYITVKNEEKEEDDDVFMKGSWHQMLSQIDDSVMRNIYLQQEQEEDDILLIDLLRSIEVEQKQYWTEMLEEVFLDGHVEVLFGELLQVVVKI
jgi:hypothetical protein